MSSSSSLVYFDLGVVILSLIIAVIYVYRKYGTKIRKPCCSPNRSCQSERTFNEPGQDTIGGVSKEIEGDKPVTLRNYAFLHLL